MPRHRLGELLRARTCGVSRILSAPARGDEGDPGESGVRIALLEGAPLEVLRHLEARFDLIHIDVSAGHPIKLLDGALTRLEVGGVVIVNGVAPAGNGPDDSQAAFCGYFLAYPQLDGVILPIGDGLAVGRKTAPLVTDQGGPF